MGREIRIEISDELHRLLEHRAAKAGISVSEYLVREMENLAELVRTARLIERLKSREPVVSAISAAELIRDCREERDRELAERFVPSP